MKLLYEFGVNSIGLMDYDKYRKKYDVIENLYFTDNQDFEQEIVSSCFDADKEDLLKKIIKQCDSKGLLRSINLKKLNSIIEKYDLDMDDVKKDQNFITDDSKILYLLFLAWMDINKSIILGRTTAEVLPKSLIPGKFKTVIEAAMVVSQNA